MGVSGSVAYMYDHLCIVGFKGLSLDETLELMIDNGIDIDDIEENDNIIIYGNPTDLYKIKEAINSRLANVNFEIDEIVMLPKDKIKLSGEDLESFEKMIKMLEEIEDVQHIYHNVEI